MLRTLSGMRLVTPQTSAEGKKVNSVLVAEDVILSWRNRN